MSGTVVKQQNYKKLFNDRAGRRMLIMLGLLAVCVVIYVVFFSSREIKGEISKVNNAPNIPSAQGSVPPTPIYQENLALADKQRQSTAKGNDLALSYTPTMTVQSTAEKLPPTLNIKETAPPPPLPDVKPQQAPRVVQELPKNQAPQQQAAQQARAPQIVYVPQPVQTSDPELLEAMKKQMGLITKPVNPAVTVTFADPKALGDQQGSDQRAAQSSVTQSSSGYQAQAQAMRAPVPTGSYSPGYTGVNYANLNRNYGNAQGRRFSVPAPGTIIYSHLIGKINSDTPGPVIGEVLQGPFSGARLLGAFQFSEQGVVIKFTTMTVPYKDENGVEKTEVMPISAVAVDSANLGTAMASDIDRHLMERIAVGFATSFLQGLGQAIASSGSSTVLDSTGTAIINNPVRSSRDQLYQAGGTAAGNVGQIFNQYYGNRRTTVTVDADTPFGLLFLSNNAGQ